MRKVRGREAQKEIKRYREMGKTYGQIGIILGISKQRVKKIEQYNYKKAHNNFKCVYPKVKQWIKDSNLEIEDLALMFNCSQPRIRAVLSGTVPLKLKDIIVLERNLGKPIEEIIL